MEHNIDTGETTWPEGGKVESKEYKVNKAQLNGTTQYWEAPSGITNKDWEEIYNNGIPMSKEEMPPRLKEKLIKHFGLEKGQNNLKGKTNA